MRHVRSLAPGDGVAGTTPSGRWHSGPVRLLLVAAGGLLLTWIALLVALAVLRPPGATVADAARLLPDLVGLVRRLAADPDVPRSVRLTLVVLVGYLVFPLDLVPDFLPAIGYADDAIVVALALRRVARTAGADAITRNWAGSAPGLAVVRRLAGVEPWRDEAPPGRMGT